MEIDAARVERQLNPLLFGMHIEWVQDGQHLLDPALPELRPAVLGLLRPLRIPLFRFPGGIHADYYDWRLGVGPPQERGESRNVFTGKRERHRFGTPELLQLLEATGGEALITANYGTGTAGEAAAWARYFASAGVSPRFWEIGNEIYLSGPRTEGPNGRRIYHPPEQYARDFTRYRDEIRDVLPRAQVGIIAYSDQGAFPLAPPESRGWSERMLRVLTGRADFVAVHTAYAPVILDDSVDLADREVRLQVYRSLYSAALQARDGILAVARAVDRLSPGNRGIPIAVTELGPLFGISARPDRHAAYVDQTRTLAAALYVASVLDVLIGEPRVEIACYTNPTHPWYGSLITDTREGLVKTPTYHLYALYRSRFARQIVWSKVASPSFDAPGVGLVRARTRIPDLIVRASVDDRGRKLTAMLVNRSETRTLAATLELQHFTPRTVDCRILAAPSPAAINGRGLTRSTLSGGREIAPRPFPCAAGRPIRLDLPPSSILSLVAER
ncbi:MAG TPA: alpha-L-arabinofuranosidase C-terminal domain-containing protein [Thermoanaerobaculia bacterium]|nr:alpha-L-arabinofuranosidase C-terminal domain-containing protein [Thermoanaerobaculia bacterium]